MSLLEAMTCKFTNTSAVSPVRYLLTSFLIRLSCNRSSLIIAFRVWYQTLKLVPDFGVGTTPKNRKRELVITDVMTRIFHK